MISRLWLLVPLILSVFFLTTPLGLAQEKTGPIEILEADEQHLLLELSLPDLEFEPFTYRRVQYHRLTVDGWSYWGQPGQPQIPMYNIPVGMPRPGNPQISILETDSQLLEGYRLSPVSGLTLGGTAESPVIVEEFILDADAYEADTTYPGPLVEATEHGYLREQPLFQLRLYPFQYNPQRQELRVYRRLKVLITFHEAQLSLAETTVAEPALPVFDNLLQRILVNYDSLPQHTTSPSLPSNPPLDGEIGALDTQGTYIIITHPNFYEASLALASYRASQGETVVVVKTDEIYDQYSGGVKDPEAIRDFLVNAYANWSPKPVYVVLIGDANVSVLTNPDVATDYLPAHYEDVPLFDNAPIDAWYAKVHGDDIYPDLIVGRIPARSASEVTTVINKVQAFEQSPPLGDWMRRAVLVADNGHSAFPGDMEIVADFLPPSIIPTKMYSYSPLTSVPNVVGPGALILAYSGHGNSTSWGSWPDGGNIYSKYKISNMWNGNKLPFMTVANCSNGYFAKSSPARVLAEEFLLIQNKGGIASWAPSSYAFPSINTPINEALYRTIFVDNDRILGSAAKTARIEAYLDNPHLPLSLFETFSFFGDPAVRLSLPAVLELRGQAAPDPVVMGNEITYTLAYTVSGADKAPGLTLVNTLPQALIYQSASIPPSLMDGQNLTWNLGDVPGIPAGNGTIEVIAQVSTSGLTHGQVLLNQARLYDATGGDQVVQLETIVIEEGVTNDPAGEIYLPILIKEP